MRKTHDLVATVGAYKSGDQEKKRYVNVGAIFAGDDGRMSIKLETIPVGPNWSGWLSAFEPRQGERQEPRGKMPPAESDRGRDDLDSIPF